jgi:hypothetical protein
MNNKNIIAVQSLLRCIDIASLRNPEVVENLVRAFGLVRWGGFVLGKDDLWQNAAPEMAGLYQTPGQLAPALVYLSAFKIKSYLEVGVFQGGTFLFISEYLKRFNPGIRCDGLDPTGYLNSEIAEIIKREPWMNFIPETSDVLKGKRYDLVFIDGDHTNGWPLRDWENLGESAAICMIHDIQEQSCPDCIELWDTVKNTKGKTVVEFVQHSADAPLQGIGILHDRGTRS